MIMKFIVIQIRVIPSSNNIKYQVMHDGTLKIYIKSAPEKGKANNELVKYLSKMLFIPINQISIISGISTKNKKIKILNIDMSMFNKIFGIHGTQMKI